MYIGPLPNNPQQQQQQQQHMQDDPSGDGSDVLVGDKEPIEEMVASITLTRLPRRLQNCPIDFTLLLHSIIVLVRAAKIAGGDAAIAASMSARLRGRLVGRWVRLLVLGHSV